MVPRDGPVPPKAPQGTKIIPKGCLNDTETLGLAETCVCVAPYVSANETGNDLFTNTHGGELDIIVGPIFCESFDRMLAKISLTCSELYGVQW